MIRALVLLLVVWSFGVEVYGRECRSCRDVSNLFLQGTVKRKVLDVVYNSNETAGVDPTHALGAMIRMSFHDSGTFAKSSRDGQANGCILSDDPGHGGLFDVMELLAQAWNELPPRDFSQADFVQFAAFVAVEETFRIMNENGNAFGVELPKLVYRFGRRDAQSCPTGVTNAMTIELERSRLPSPHAGTNLVRNKFLVDYGLTVEDMVALLGAHTIGSAVRERSFWNGKWTTRNMEFDIDYYKNILDREWNRVRLTDSRGPEVFQWATPGDNELFMLNSDLSLAFDIGNTGQGCNTTTPNGSNRCQPGPEDARKFVIDYAGGEDRDVKAGLHSWFRAFSVALTKLSELGFDATDLIEPCDGPLPPGCPIDVPTPAPTPPISTDSIRANVTLLFQEQYRESYHGSSEYQSELAKACADAFGLPQDKVRVTHIQRGQLIATIAMELSSWDEGKINVFDEREVTPALKQKFSRAREVYGNLLVSKVESDTESPYGDDDLTQGLMNFGQGNVSRRNTLLGTFFSSLFVLIVAAVATKYLDGSVNVEEEREMIRKAQLEKLIPDFSPIAYRLSSSLRP